MGVFFYNNIKFRYNSEQVVQCYWRDGSMLVNGDSQTTSALFKNIKISQILNRFTSYQTTNCL